MGDSLSDQQIKNLKGGSSFLLYYERESKLHQGEYGGCVLKISNDFANLRFFLIDVNNKTKPLSTQTTDHRSLSPTPSPPTRPRTILTPSSPPTSGVTSSPTAKPILLPSSIPPSSSSSSTPSTALVRQTSSGFRPPPMARAFTSPNLLPSLPLNIPASIANAPLVNSKAPNKAGFQVPAGYLLDICLGAYCAPSAPAPALSSTPLVPISTYSSGVETRRRSSSVPSSDEVDPSVFFTLFFSSIKPLYLKAKDSATAKEWVEGLLKLKTMVNHYQVGGKSTKEEKKDSHPSGTVSIEESHIAYDFVRQGVQLLRYSNRKSRPRLCQLSIYSPTNMTTPPSVSLVLVWRPLNMRCFTSSESNSPKSVASTTVANLSSPSPLLSPGFGSTFLTSSNPTVSSTTCRSLLVSAGTGSSLPTLNPGIGTLNPGIGKTILSPSTSAPPNLPPILTKMSPSPSPLDKVRLQYAAISDLQTISIDTGCSIFGIAKWPFTLIFKSALPPPSDMVSPPSSPRFRERAFHFAAQSEVQRKKFVDSIRVLQKLSLEERDLSKMSYLSSPSLPPYFLPHVLGSSSLVSALSSTSSSGSDNVFFSGKSKPPKLVRFGDEDSLSSSKSISPEPPKNSVASVISMKPFVPPPLKTSMSSRSVLGGGGERSVPIDRARMGSGRSQLSSLGRSASGQHRSMVLMDLGSFIEKAAESLKNALKASEETKSYEPVRWDGFFDVVGDGNPKPASEEQNSNVNGITSPLIGTGSNGDSSNSSNSNNNSTRNSNSPLIGHMINNKQNLTTNKDSVLTFFEPIMEERKKELSPIKIDVMPKLLPSVIIKEDSLKETPAPSPVLTPLNVPSSDPAIKETPTSSSSGTSTGSSGSSEVIFDGNFFDNHKEASMSSCDISTVQPKEDTGKEETYPSDDEDDDGYAPTEGATQKSKKGLDEDGRAIGDFGPQAIVSQDTQATGIPKNTTFTLLGVEEEIEANPKKDVPEDGRPIIAGDFHEDGQPIMGEEPRYESDEEGDDEGDGAGGGGGGESDEEPPPRRRGQRIDLTNLESVIEDERPKFDSQRTQLASKKPGINLENLESYNEDLPHEDLFSKPTGNPIRANEEPDDHPSPPANPRKTSGRINLFALGPDTDHGDPTKKSMARIEMAGSDEDADDEQEKPSKGRGLQVGSDNEEDYEDDPPRFTRKKTPGLRGIDLDDLASYHEDNDDRGGKKAASTSRRGLDLANLSSVNENLDEGNGGGGNSKKARIVEDSEENDVVHSSIDEGRSIEGQPQRLVQENDGRSFFLVPDGSKVVFENKKLGLKISSGGGISDIDLVNLGIIGKGNNGAVIKCLLLPTLTRVAIKAMCTFQREGRKQMEKEVGAFGSVTSTNIVTFIGAFFAVATSQIKLASEYMDCGSLDRWINLSEPVLRHLSWQMFRGLVDLHAKRAVHRDIKPLNILMHHTGAVKIADLGLVKIFEEGKEFDRDIKGTQLFLSPERLLGNAYSYNADVWAMGLSIAYCALGCLPWGLDGNLQTVFDLLCCINPRGEEQRAPVLPKDRFSEELIDMLEKCLEPDPTKRPQAKDILFHPFFYGANPEYMQELTNFVNILLGEVKGLTRIVLDYLYDVSILEEWLLELKKKGDRRDLKDVLKIVVDHHNLKNRREEVFASLAAPAEPIPGCVPVDKIYSCLANEFGFTPTEIHELIRQHLEQEESKEFPPMRLQRDTETEVAGGVGGLGGRGVRVNRLGSGGSSGQRSDDFEKEQKNIISGDVEDDGDYPSDENEGDGVEEEEMPENVQRNIALSVGASVLRGIAEDREYDIQESGVIDDQKLSDILSFSSSSSASTFDSLPSTMGNLPQNNDALIFSDLLPSSPSSSSACSSCASSTSTSTSTSTSPASSPFTSRPASTSTSLSPPPSSSPLSNSSIVIVSPSQDTVLDKSSGSSTVSMSLPAIRLSNHLDITPLASTSSDVTPLALTSRTFTDVTPLAPDSKTSLSPPNSRSKFLSLSPNHRDLTPLASKQLNHRDITPLASKLTMNHLDITPLASKQHTPSAFASPHFDVTPLATTSSSSFTSTPTKNPPSATSPASPPLGRFTISSPNSASYSSSSSSSPPISSSVSLSTAVLFSSTYSIPQAFAFPTLHLLCADLNPDPSPSLSPNGSTAESSPLRQRMNMHPYQEE